MQAVLEMGEDRRWIEVLCKREAAAAPIRNRNPHEFASAVERMAEVIGVDIAPNWMGGLSIRKVDSASAC